MAPPQQPPWYSAALLQDGTWNWVEQSIELLTMCDVNCSEQPPPLLLKQEEKQVPTRDYALLHDEFLESLLQELHARDDETVASSMSRQSSFLSSSSSRQSSFLSSSSSSVHGSEESSSCKRRRRTFRRSCSALVKSQKRQVADVSALPPRDASSVSTLVRDSSRRDLPEPHCYIHDNCRLQKDKGKGEAIGTEICASGKDACLKKVRQKMDLLMQLAVPEAPRTKRSPAMKQKMAITTSIAEDYSETRSLIQFKMGLLSMQYGVLLRWDLTTGKIVLILLRKMCHDSFYKISFKRDAVSTMNAPPEWFLEGGSHAIFQRPDGTEVALLDAPFKVERPNVFEPSRLLTQVSRAEGLNPLTIWFIQFKLDEEERRSQLIFNEDLGRWTSTDPLEWELPLLNAEYVLKVALLEQKRPSRTRKKERLASQVFIPLIPSRVSERRQVCLSGNGFRITLNVYHQSDYAYWLHQELEARKRQEVTGFVWKMPLYRKKLEVEEEDLWDFCCVC